MTALAWFAVRLLLAGGPVSGWRARIDLSHRREPCRRWGLSRLWAPGVLAACVWLVFVVREKGCVNAGRGGSPPRGGVVCLLFPYMLVSGGVLLSHTVSGAVPSALVGLTSGFGMGPGVSPPL
jgi:hypothetical protein